MNVVDLQRAIGTQDDGKFGPLSRAALIAAFTNKTAPKMTDQGIATFAAMLRCSPQQLRAVAAVESSGSGFDSAGRPKMLFERHLFHRLTNGRWDTTPFSDPRPGGYDEDSWMKLALACARDPDAAFSSASWGAFQVLGAHWAALHYDSPYSLAVSTVRSEAAQYELLVRFIEANGLAPALRKISSNPADNVDFARQYNGPTFRKFSYDSKLAEAMA